MKNKMKVNESQLRNMIKESIVEIIKENWQDTAHEWANKMTGNEFEASHDGPGDDNIREEIRLYNKVKAEFEEQFGPGSFEKARKASKFARFNPFASDAAKAYDKWNRGVK